MNQTVTTTVESPQTLPAVVPATPMELIASAIDRGMSPDVIEKLMALQERYEANLSRKAFDAAMAAANNVNKKIIDLGLDKRLQTTVDSIQEDVTEIKDAVVEA